MPSFSTSPLAYCLSSASFVGSRSVRILCHSTSSTSHQSHVRSHCICHPRSSRTSVICCAPADESSATSYEASNSLHPQPQVAVSTAQATSTTADTDSDKKAHGELPSHLFWSAAAIELGLAVVGYAASQLFNLHPNIFSTSFPVTPAIVFEAIGWTVPFFLVFKLLEAFPTKAYQATENVVRRLLLPRKVWEIIVFCACAGIGEEVLFRGFLQTFLIQNLHLGQIPSVAIASLCFGAAHFVTPLYFVLSSVAGGYFGWLTIKTGSLVQPIIVHALYDALAALWIRARLLREREQET